MDANIVRKAEELLKFLKREKFEFNLSFRDQMIQCIR